MKRRLLLRDVNLSEIVFPSETSDIVLTFLNMTDGALAGSLVCRGLLAFTYHCPPDEKLPQYIGEVALSRVDDEEAREILERVGYRFESGTNPRGVFSKVSVEGAVTIDVVCREVQLLP